MKQPTYTPGPWTTRRALKKSDGGFDYSIEDSEGCILAEAFEVVGHDIKRNAYANAQAIAAVPNLISALTGLATNAEEVIASLESADVPSTVTRYLRETVCIAQAALARTKGS